VYWSNNKGGPLFQFGCVDYGGYPMMPYYAVKRIFDPIGVHVYRDVRDMVVMLSNHSAEKLPITVEAWHVDKSGKTLGSWSWTRDIESGALERVARLDDLYEKINNRLEEVIYVCAFHNNNMAAEDMFFPCPFREFEGTYKPLKILTEKLGSGAWRITLEAGAPVRLVELESNQKLLYTDDYFPLINGKPKTVEARLLEKTNEGPVDLRVGILGSPDVQRVTLD
jgi:beta-mannosidase